MTHSQDGEDLSGIQLVVVELGDEDGRHTLEDGGTVHVDSGADGQDETADAFVHAVVFLHTLDHGGQGRRADRERSEI